jgi:hypothetical protein
VHIPWGFIYDGRAAHPDKSLRTEIKNFEGFWLSRHCIATRFYGGGCSKESWVIDPRQFAVLYALNQNEFQDASNLIPEGDQSLLSDLLDLDVGPAWDWKAAEAKWTEMRDRDGIIFVLAHSDGVELHLQEEGSPGGEINPDRFSDIFAKSEGSSSATLCILNGCTTAIGNGTLSYMAATARDSFCGFIGTEAKVTNRDALLYSTRLMSKLCREPRLTLRDAFEAMRTDASLFPRSLSYSCFAHPDFGLAKGELNRRAA